MTRDEFGDILARHYFPLFPETAKYIRSQPEETRAAWAKLFEQQDSRDLIAALARLSDGSEDVPAYEREKIGVILLRMTRDQRIERLRSAERRRTASLWREQQQLRQQRGEAGIDQLPSIEAVGLGPAMREITHAIEQARRVGKTDDEVEEIRASLTESIVAEVAAGKR